MATATGKTVAGIAAIAECCGVLPEDPDHEPRTDDAKIMIVAHSNAILKQWEQEIQEKLGLPMPAGQTGEQAESVSFSGGEVEFYTAQSLLPRYDRDLADQYDPSSTTKFTTTQLRWDCWGRHRQTQLSGCDGSFGDDRRRR